MFKLNNLNEVYRQDLEYFLNLAEAKRGSDIDPEYPDEPNHLNFYFRHSRAELADWLEQYVAEHRVQSIYDFDYLMNAMLKFMMGPFDSHTGCDLPIIGNPVNTVVHIEADDDYYIDHSTESDITKAKILAINGVDIQQIKRELAGRIAHGDGDGRLAARTAWALRKPRILRTLPSIDCHPEVMEYTTNKGIIRIHIGRPVNRSEIVSDDEQSNLYASGHTVIFRYEACGQRYMVDLAELDQLLRSSQAYNFVLDLRYNGGGDDTVIKPLISYLAKCHDLKLAVLVNEDVYSSALAAIQDMRRLGAKVVGRQVCSALNVFGYGGYRYGLPGTQERVSFSRAFWLDHDHTKGGIFTRAQLDEAARRDPDFWTPHYLSLDQHISLSRDEYLSGDSSGEGSDAVMAKCLAYIRAL